MENSESEKLIEVFQFNFSKAELEFIIISVCSSTAKLKYDILSMFEYTKLLTNYGSQDQKFTLEDVESVKNKLANYLEAIHPEWKSNG